MNFSAELEHKFSDDEWGKLSVEDQAMFYQMACIMASRTLTTKDRRFLVDKAWVMKLRKSRVVIGLTVVALGGILFYSLSQSWAATLLGMALGAIFATLIYLTN